MNNRGGDKGYELKIKPINPADVSSTVNVIFDFGGSIPIAVEGAPRPLV